MENREQLKNKFRNGEVLTEQMLHDLFDAILHKQDDAEWLANFILENMPDIDLEDIELTINILKSYDIGPLGFVEEPESEEIDWLLVGVNTTIAAGNSGFAYAITPPSGNITLRILHNAEDVGEITFNAASNAGTINIFEEKNISEGDRIVIVAPVTPDATFKNFQVLIKSNLSNGNFD